jgi:hypothetical protein
MLGKTIAGCGSSMAGLSTYGRKSKLCAWHQKAAVLDMLDGVPSRFSQQCCKVQPKSPPLKCARLLASGRCHYCTCQCWWPLLFHTAHLLRQCEGSLAQLRSPGARAGGL